MIEIRVTRPERYCSPDSPGNDDLSAREGHYFRGDNLVDAINKATIRFGSECIDVEVNHGPYFGRFKRVEIHGPDERSIRLPSPPATVHERLEYLRGEIEEERISQGEIAELQSLAAYIEEGDVQLLEWAGVPEHAKE